MPFNQALDANGRAIQAIGYDPTTHQPLMPLAGPAVIDSVSGVAYAPDGASALDGFKASYASGIGGLVVVTAATDFFTLTNPGSKTIRITRCDISGAIATTAQQVEVYGIVRSAVNTGGTSTTPNIVPYDSGDPTATGVVRAYTANPASLGTSVGNVRVAKMLLGVTGGTTVQDRLIWDFGDRPTKALVLRQNQVFAIGLAGLPTFGTASSFNVYIEWTEDTYS